MKYIDWSEEKNAKLKSERDISFEEIIISIDEGGLLAILTHPNINLYKNQKILLVILNGYVYLVPCVEDEQKVFLKTIIPSRKATKQYLFK